MTPAPMQNQETHLPDTATDRRRFTRFTPKNNIGKTIFSFHEDRNNQFWVLSASNGLLLFDRKRETSSMVLNRKNGLSVDAVNFLLEDKKDHLWLGTVDGLYRFKCRSIYYGVHQ